MAGARTTEELAALETRLRELVCVLEGARTDPMAMERAWRACDAHGPAVALATSIGDEEREEVRARLRRLVELNAIAVDVANKSIEKVSVELERVRGMRARLGGLASTRETGTSCDVTS